MVARILLTILLCLMALPAWATDPLMDWESVEYATFVRSGAATYIDSDGIMQTAAENAPRLQHVPGLGLALLLEEAGTNLVSYSEDGSQWDSVGGYATATPEPGIEIAGLPANVITGQRSYWHRVDVGRVEQTGTHTLHFLASSGNTSNCRITARDPGTGRQVEFDFTIGDCNDYSGSTSLGAYSCSCMPVADGYRVSFSLTPSIDGNTIGYGIGTGTAVSTDYIYVTGALLVAAPYAGSYIPTAGSAASRATEAADATGNGFAFALADNPALAAIFEGSGRMEADIIFGADGADMTTSAGLIGVKDGIVDLLYWHTAGRIVASDGSSYVPVDQAYEAGQAYHVTLSWEAGGDFTLDVNGISNSAPFDGSFTLGTHLRLGWANPYPWQIRGLAFYDSAMGGERVAYWPFDGREYQGGSGDDEAPQACTMRSLGLRPIKAVPMRAFPLSVFP